MRVWTFSGLLLTLLGLGLFISQISPSTLGLQTAASKPSQLPIPAMALPLPPRKANPSQNQVQKMRWLETVGKKSQLVFELKHPLKASVFTLAPKKGKPHRVVLDLPKTQLSTRLPAVPAHARLISRLRSGTRDKYDLRIVLDVKQAVGVRHFWLKPSKHFGHRLVLTVDTPENAQKPLIVAPKLKPAPPAPQKYTPPAKSIAPAPRATVQPKTVPQRAPQTAPVGRKQNVVVAIDAGHGGVDPGAVGKNGTYEKHAVLLIAKDLFKLIQRTPGISAVMIRTDDRFLRLRDRIDRARKYKADMFISIHADAYPGTKDIQGASVYMLSESGASSEAAKWLAERENSADLMGGISLSDKGDTLASVLLDLSQAGTLESSGKLGQKVLGALGGIGPLHQRRVQQAAFMVLRSPDIPSILVETAFISNPKEERRLNQPAYRQRLAGAILRGIQTYIAENPLNAKVR